MPSETKSPETASKKTKRTKKQIAQTREENRLTIRRQIRSLCRRYENDMARADRLSKEQSAAGAFNRGKGYTYANVIADLLAILGE